MILICSNELNSNSPEHDMLGVNVNYKNWFVLQVNTKKEHYIKKFIENHAGEEVKMLVFSRELLFQRKYGEFKGISPLFPSYIFVYKKVKQALATVKENYLNEFIRPLCFKDQRNKCKTCFSSFSPCQVLENEMAVLLCNADHTGIIGLSDIIEKKESIQIINGPLKYLEHNVVWINKKKKRACVELDLFKRKMKVILGFNLFKNFY